uniref:Putative secreted protein n=1 Tax=Anopheles darlingi TaxID=43151 RepID=A0A2M4DG45_ANODA
MAAVAAAAAVTAVTVSVRVMAASMATSVPAVTQRRWRGVREPVVSATRSGGRQRFRSRSRSSSPVSVPSVRASYLAASSTGRCSSM